MGRMTNMLAAMSAALCARAAAAAGVCYSPFHSATYASAPSAIAQILEQDMQQIANDTMFSSVRTYHAQFYGQNVVDAVRAAGLQVAIGIQMVGSDGGVYEYLEQDIAAAVAAASHYPDTVLAIYAGNENLANGDFGSSSAQDIVDVITRVKSALQGTKGANVPVGTVQRLEEWLHASDASKLAAAADILGVNIYPFFTAGGERDMVGTLDASWSLMTAKYGSAKARLTETGWPSQGSASAAGNKPTLANAQKYYVAFNEWAAATKATTPFYFMMYDLLSTQQGTTDYEQHFGLSTATGAIKFDLGASSSSASRTSSSSSVTSSSSSSSSSSPSTSPSASSGTTSSSSNSASTTVSTIATPALNQSSKTSSSATSDQGEDDGDEVAGEADRSMDEVTTAPSPVETLAPVVTTTTSNSDSSSAGDDGSSFLGTDFVAGVPSPFTDEPAASADLGQQTFAPVPTTSASKEAEEELKAQEAQAKRAQDISGNQDTSIMSGAAVVGFCGIAAVVVIAMYVQKSRNASADATISITTADARESTPSVYSDPLGTRFSSIVMITPNGDGVCIL
uniref:glucan endo-1,3-beta-D-glucosidase n=1 Tax=Globisporangium ultimum (strain ATCC 200006 / CBS 805.95 / DAOM BR144) TaxID=431595 RepID=K3X9A4_GLOUD